MEVKFQTFIQISRDYDVSGQNLLAGDIIFTIGISAWLWDVLQSCQQVCSKLLTIEFINLYQCHTEVPTSLYDVHFYNPYIKRLPRWCTWLLRISTFTFRPSRRFCFLQSLQTSSTSVTMLSWPPIRRGLANQNTNCKEWVKVIVT